MGRTYRKEKEWGKPKKTRQKSKITEKPHEDTYGRNREGTTHEEKLHKKYTRRPA